MTNESILSFFYEMGHLARVKREGWRLLGIESPESIAEHSLRAAQIAWVLAKLEGLQNPHAAVTIAVFHDIGECRVGDLHKLASRYGELDEARAVKEQCERLGEIGLELFGLWEQVETRSTPEGVVAKDADLLELAVRAKEYIERGYVGAQEWINAVTPHIKTNSGRALLATIPSTTSTDWWKGLKKV